MPLNIFGFYLIGWHIVRIVTSYVQFGVKKLRSGKTLELTALNSEHCSLTIRYMVSVVLGVNSSHVMICLST